MLRSLGALGLVLGMLAGALWVVRRYDVRLPGRVSATRRKRVELVERLAIDAKRSIALIRRDECEHLILLGPEGHATIETGIAAPPAPPADRDVPQTAPSAAGQPFGQLVEFPRPAPRKRTREPRDTARWNRAAVREALNA